MNNKSKVFAMIPARAGSERLKSKNLSLINGEPMISYSINAAKDSKVFDKIIINSDDDKYFSIANEFGVEFYKRPKQLGSSNTRSDEVIYDFIEKHQNANIVVWVNPIAPFQNGQEIKKIVNYFVNKKLDSLITTEEKKSHCNFNSKPINYVYSEPFQKTQDLIPVEIFSYTLMMWNSKSFFKKYKECGHAIFCGNFATHPVSKLSTLIVKDKEDLQLVDYIMRSNKNKNLLDYRVKYHPLVNLQDY